jgi:septum formation protein
VVVSSVDESAVTAALGTVTPTQLCLELARAKARDVAAGLPVGADAIVIGCDSVFELAGVAYGKPESPAQAKERWTTSMAGRHGTLRTGHWLVHASAGREVGDVASTEVWHATPSDQELDAYIATGEPLRVAGGFTLDGLGGPFVERIDGDPSNVMGLSLPLLRLLLGELGIVWTDLWSSP